jgi:YVTN family beta-propeller protein
MQSTRFASGRIVAAVIGGLIGIGAGTGAAMAQTMIVGNDEKTVWNAELKQTFGPPGHDTLSILDISNPAAPRITATIPLINTIVGPPTNLAVTPSGDLALVANSLKPLVNGWARSLVPDDKVYVVDLKASPPAIVGTVTVGKQPSGMAISPNGRLALVANRADGTISVLSIDGKTVKLVGTVTVGPPSDSVSAVAISPDGKHALAALFLDNKIAQLSIDGDKVTDDNHDLPVGINPYNVAISPDGKIALTADNGHMGSSDGNADTVSVIDLTANPVRVINHITVGDSPEGLAISPKGTIAVAVEARGSNVPKSVFFHHATGAVSVLKIDGTTVTRVGEVEVGALPEGAAFSPDGSHIYVGNSIDRDISVLKVDGTTVTNTGQNVELPGHPASMRSGPQ